MQNFLAIALFAALIGVVFWPEDLFRNEESNSKIRSAVGHSQETNARSNAIQAGNGFVRHYLGIERENTNND